VSALSSAMASGPERLFDKGCPGRPQGAPSCRLRLPSADTESFNANDDEIGNDEASVPEKKTPPLGRGQEYIQEGDL